MTSIILMFAYPDAPWSQRVWITDFLLYTYLHKMQQASALEYWSRAKYLMVWFVHYPSCMYDMHASYLHMDIPIPTRFEWHTYMLSLHMDIPATHHACMAYIHGISPHGHTRHPSCLYGIYTWYLSTWTYPLPIMLVWHIYMVSLHIDIPATHHACMAYIHGISPH